MSRKNSILVIAALFVLVIGEAYFLQETFRERNELKTKFSRVLELKNMLQREFWGTEQMLRSLQATVREKTGLLSREQAVTHSLKQQVLRSDQEFGSVLDELSRVSREKAEIEADFDDVLAELDKLKKSKQASLKAKLEELKNDLTESNKAITLNKRELKKLKRKNLVFSEENEYLKLKVERAEPERLKLYTELQGAKQELQKQTDMLNARQKELLDMDTLNQEFKKHTEQLSALLIKKELDLEDTGKELLTAKAEIVDLRSLISGREGQLTETRAELEKTTKLLLDVTELSAGLEEKLNPYVQTKKERNKADELKRKVEVLMYPEK